MKARTEEQISHVRRCHVCGTVNESENQAIRSCKGCGKHLAPFYYFDESELKGLDVGGLHFSVMKNFDPEVHVETFKPLWGFSTYW